MVIRTKKKVRKYRGSKTHGGGAMKKRRGAGHRGGRGNAGTGKRADQKKPSILKEFGNTYFGKRGFIKKNATAVKAVTLDYLNNKADNLVSRNLVKKEKGTYVIDLKKIGFDKVLGSGKVTKKFKILANKATPKAAEKLKAAGGSIELNKVKLNNEKKEKRE
ncbi:MAG: uL15 family ribosomal protein [Nanoarchaeota archaeon]|nr:uL15 family ribosomal protein [Nanoarchaeota archaeon]